MVTSLGVPPSAAVYGLRARGGDRRADQRVCRRLYQTNGFFGRGATARADAGEFFFTRGGTEGQSRRMRSFRSLVPSARLRFFRSRSSGIRTPLSGGLLGGAAVDDGTGGTLLGVYLAGVVTRGA